MLLRINSILLLLLVSVSCKPRTELSSDSLEATAPHSGGVIDLTTFMDATEEDYERMQAEIKRVCKTKSPTTCGYSIEEGDIAGNPSYAYEHSQYNKIPLPELVALRIYTGNSYREINQALRTNDPANLPEWSGVIKSAAAGMNKMPDFEGTTIREAKLDKTVIDSYIPGQIKVEKAFTSATFNDKIPGSNTGNVKFVMKSLHGKKIDWLSVYPNEREVLFTPGSEFKVVSKKDGDMGITIIEMEQVEVDP